MFTGLIQERGRIVATPEPSAEGGLRLWIGHSPELAKRLSLGASLAVSGVCLTIVEQEADRSRVELAPETVARSTVGDLRAGDEVNLEPALRMGDPLGGHWVQGHVDGVLPVLARRDLEAHRELAFGFYTEEAAGDHRASIVEKGSVTLDGVSLTVARLEADRFTVALIPHTLAVTTLGDRVPGERVNFEADVLAKYVQRALALAAPIPSTA